MCIYFLNRHQKISIDKQKLSDLGRTRPTKLEALHSLMAKTLSQIAGVKKSTPRGPKSRSRALIELLADANSTSDCKYNTPNKYKRVNQ